MRICLEISIPEAPECPICMLPLPLQKKYSRVLSCCGKLICLGCLHAQIKAERKNGKDVPLCAFCRTPYTKSVQEFVNRLKKGVERNDTNSMEQLAICYLNGKCGLQKDRVKAKELFQKAAEHGCASAYGWLGILHPKGTGKDMKKAKHYLELGVIEGDMISRYILGRMDMMNGKNVRALKHFLICAKAGYEPSLHPIKLYFKGGYMTKSAYAVALRACKKQQADRKSAMRDEALVYCANPSLYNQKP